MSRLLKLIEQQFGPPTGVRTPVGEEVSVKEWEEWAGNYDYTPGVGTHRRGQTKSKDWTPKSVREQLQRNEGLKTPQILAESKADMAEEPYECGTREYKIFRILKRYQRAKRLDKADAVRLDELTNDSLQAVKQANKEVELSYLTKAKAMGNPKEEEQEQVEAAKELARQLLAGRRLPGAAPAQPMLEEGADADEEEDEDGEDEEEEEEEPAEAGDLEMTGPIGAVSMDGLCPYCEQSLHGNQDFSDRHGSCIQQAAEDERRVEALRKRVKEIWAPSATSNTGVPPAKPAGENAP